MLSRFLLMPVRKQQGEIRAAFRDMELISKTDLLVSRNCMNCLGVVIKETFRMYPSTPILVPRESTQACQTNGQPYRENVEESRTGKFKASRMDFHDVCFGYTPFKGLQYQ
ncbi:hypothetical protein D1007_12145 [Hordeum vulgare]|nr:hypothetical protein D1007_12145 [Hordeum vulgare]